MTKDQLQQQAFTATKDLFERRFGRVTNPLEIYQNGWYEVQFPLLLKPKSVQLTIYVQAHFLNVGNGVAIATKLGFRSSYNKEKWQHNRITGTMLFDAEIDDVYDEIDFVYKGTNYVNAIDGFMPLNCQNFLPSLEQFYADIEENLNGSYQFMLNDIN